MTNRQIVVENLVKRYKDFEAVKCISFQVADGEVFGFLGPNGAGKSTTVSILTTLTLPTEGNATVGGFDIRTQAAEVRQVAGVATQEIGLDPLMKSMELLTLQAQLFGIGGKRAAQRAYELLELVKLTDPKTMERRVGQYSGGMRRRLDLAMALVHEPQILFLDEPTTGLDPASRRDVWAEVRRLNQQLGMTIFLTTQYLEEADELANRVAIINAGQIAVEGTPAQLKAQIGSDAINVTFESADVARQAQQAIGGMSAKPSQLDGPTLSLYLNQAASAVPTVVSRLQGANFNIASLTLTRPTLDDVFLAVTGQRLQMAAPAPNPAESPFGRRSAPARLS